MSETLPDDVEILAPSKTYEGVYHLSVPVEEAAVFALLRVATLSQTNGTESLRCSMAMRTWAVGTASLPDHRVGLWRAGPDVEPIACMDEAAWPTALATGRLGRLCFNINMETAGILMLEGPPFRPQVERAVALGSAVVDAMYNELSPGVLGCIEGDGEFQRYDGW